jgi:hypothetical protein
LEPCAGKVGSELVVQAALNIVEMTESWMVGYSGAIGNPRRIDGSGRRLCEQRYAANVCEDDCAEHFLPCDSQRMISKRAWTFAKQAVQLEKQIGETFI